MTAKARYIDTCHSGLTFTMLYNGSQSWIMIVEKLQEHKIVTGILPPVVGNNSTSVSLIMLIAGHTSASSASSANSASFANI